MYWDALTVSGVFVSVVLSVTMLFLSRLSRQ
jgi:hypothetical protein